MTAPSGDTVPRLTALASIKRLLKPKAEFEHCGLCGALLGDEHPHLLELGTRRLVCACVPCALLFSGPESARYRRVPQSVQALPNFQMSDEAWEALQLPINLAFFVFSTTVGRVVALYPSPAGSMEAIVDLGAWTALTDQNPVLRELQPDIEGLLVNRVGEARGYYRVGIDECYRLAGLIRTHWRGFSGGEKVWDEIARFFDGLRERSR
jgi:uncharacterized protein DUF5947